MRNLLVLLVLLAVPSLASAQEAKPEEKKKPVKSAKSGKNVFQKAESAVGDFAQRNKIWTKSEPRGKAAKNP